MSAEDEKKSAKGGAKAKVVKVAEKGVVGPRVKEGEHVFGVAHIYASFNDTFIVITNLLYLLLFVYV